MFRLFFSLVFLGFCLLIGYIISSVPVKMAIQLPEYTITGNLVIWCILSLVLAWILIFLTRLLRFLWHSPQYFCRSMTERKRNKAHKYLKNGLSALISGHYHKAEKYFVFGGDLAEEVGESSVIYFENAAIAANYLNAENRRQRYLLRARQHVDNQYHDILARLNEAEMHVAHGRHQQAIALLEDIRTQESKNIKVLTLLESAYAENGDWEKGWQILPKLKEHMSKDVHQTRQKIYAKGLLNNVSNDSDIGELEKIWKSLPAHLHQEQEIVLLYAGTLIENGHSDVAERFLSDKIQTTQNINFIQAYSQLRSGNFASQLTNMKSWEHAHANDALFLYAKALVAYKAKDYDCADQAIEAALQQHPSKEAFALWAQILEAKNQPEAALSAYRQSIHAVAIDETLKGDLLPSASHERKSLT